MLKKLQCEHFEWAKHNFGEQRPWQPLLGIMEELGELAHAHLKQSQDIRNNEDHQRAAKDAIGDIIIFLANYCNIMKYDLDSIVRDTWEQVKQRDWKKNPNNAHIGLGDTNKKPIQFWDEEVGE
jgi:NTP pyrophosphatase (non-canonical NTP hydrolase)